MTTHSDEPAPTVDQMAQGLGALLAAAVASAKTMGDWPACERRVDDDACGAVLMANVDDAGSRHIHYCAQTADQPHVTNVTHVCVCGQDWTERVDGVAEVVGPNETIVRPAEEP